MASVDGSIVQPPGKGGHQLLKSVSRRKATILLLASIIGGVLGLSYAVTAGQFSPRILVPEPVDTTTGSALQATASESEGEAVTPLATRTHDGFEVTLLDDATRGSVRILTYTVTLVAATGFADMVGIPRIINADGSIVLPREYGPVDPSQDLARGRPGIQSGTTAAAIYKPESISPGAVLRFGPFFRAEEVGFDLSASFAELAAGVELVVGGEPFLASVSSLEGGSLEFRFQPLAPNPAIVATHPTTKAVISANGEILREIRGSTSFAKTEELDVHANTSTVVVQGPVAPEATIKIVVDSIGSVVRGQWDFPVD
jgi:hypothetical protein